MSKKKKKFEMAHANTKSKCACCDEDKPNKDFLVNRSFMYRARGRVVTCDDCMVELYDILISEVEEESKADVDGNKIALYRLCQMFDYMYSESLYKGSVKQAEKLGSGYLLLYLQKIGSLHQYRFKRFKHSDKNPMQKTTVNIEEDFTLTKEIVLRWGKGYEIEDYIQLENFFQQMVESSGCDDPIKENTLKNISKTQLKADRALSDNNIQDYDRLAKLISTMMKDGGITPSTQNNDNDGKATMGMWVKALEEDEPVPTPLAMFKDVDRLKYYIDKYFVQHFARVFGIVNENDVDYSDDYKPTSNEDEGEDNED